MNCGIYHIRNVVTGMRYFGRTVDWSKRKSQHLRELQRNSHVNSKLQHAWNKYGAEKFEFSLVWPAPPENHVELESMILEEAFDLGVLYNLHKSADGGMKGMRHSEESKRRAIESRRNSGAWAAHQRWMQSVEAISTRCRKAAQPEVRARAVATRSANGHKPFSDEVRQRQKDEARARVFAALDWAVANNGTRDAALKMFSCSWGGLKKYQPEWEAINGPLSLPKRASGERNGLFKHGRSKEQKRKKTPDELKEINRKRSEQMSGRNNPMFGRKHTDEAKAIQSAAAKRQAMKKKGLL